MLSVSGLFFPYYPLFTPCLFYLSPAGVTKGKLPFKVIDKARLCD